MNPSAARVLPEQRARFFTCSACGTIYGDEAWHGLELTQRIEPVELRRHVLEWPENLTVEVRACRSCKAMIARKR